MKKTVILLAIMGLIVSSGCEGPRGDQGPQGLQGFSGKGSVVYENPSNNRYSFTSDNNFKVRFRFPSLIGNSEVVLVYRLGDVVDSDGKGVWEILPETRYRSNEDIRDFSFNFNFTYEYVDIYLSGLGLESVPESFRLNQTFRIVVVPANLPSSINKKDYFDVINKLDIKKNQIQEINF